MLFRKLQLVVASTLILAATTVAQPQEVSTPPRLASGLSLDFVPAYKPPLPPDYLAIKKSSDERIEADRQAAAALEAQRQAQAAQQAAQQAYVAQTVVLDDAKTFIYLHESGNRTDAINASSGACGLGQALPCSKLPCGLSDYACQDAWFTQYAISRYGSWAAAEAFWIANSWW